MSITEKNKLVCSSQTKSYMKVDDKTRNTSKANYAKQIIQQSDDMNDMNAFIVHLKPENELEMDQMVLPKVNEDDVIRLNELRRFLATRVGEKKSTISCLKDDITKFVTSKENAKKKLLEQKDEISDLSVKLSIESDSCNKIKRLSKENQTKTTRLHEIVTVSTVFKEEKENKISCWNDNILGLNTSKEGSRKQIILQRHETTELSVKL